MHGRSRVRTNHCHEETSDASDAQRQARNHVAHGAATRHLPDRPGRRDHRHHRPPPDLRDTDRPATTNSRSGSAATPAASNPSTQPTATPSTSAATAPRSGRSTSRRFSRPGWLSPSNASERTDFTNTSRRATATHPAVAGRSHVLVVVAGTGDARGTLRLPCRPPPLVRLATSRRSFEWDELFNGEAWLTIEGRTSDIYRAVQQAPLRATSLQTAPSCGGEAWDYPAPTQFIRTGRYRPRSECMAVTPDTRYRKSRSPPGNLADTYKSPKPRLRACKLAARPYGGCRPAWVVDIGRSPHEAFVG